MEELLRQAGITSHTDSANQYTPGQKMKYWWVGAPQSAVGDGMCVVTHAHMPLQGDEGVCMPNPVARVHVPRSVVSMASLRRETAGVKVRVELGPQDAEEGSAVVALAGEPGTVAKKKKVNVVTQLVREVKRALERVSLVALAAGLFLGLLVFNRGGVVWALERVSDMG